MTEQQKNEIEKISKEFAAQFKDTVGQIAGSDLPIKGSWDWMWLEFND